MRNKLKHSFFKIIGLGILLSIMLFTSAAYADVVNFYLNGTFWKASNYTFGSNVPFPTKSDSNDDILGWYSDASYSGTQITSAISSLSNNCSLYGRTKKKITFVDSTKSTTTAATAFVNQKLSTGSLYNGNSLNTNWPTVTYSDGSTFLGWFSDPIAGCGTELTKDTVVTEDMALTYYDHKLSFITQPSDITVNLGEKVTISWAMTETPDNVYITKMDSGHETTWDKLPDTSTSLNTTGTLNSSKNAYTFTTAQAATNTYYKIILEKNDKRVYSKSFLIEVKVPKYIISANVTPAKSGALMLSGSTPVSSYPYSVSAEKDSIFRLTAVEGKGYEFVEWRDKSGNKTSHAAGKVLTYTVSGMQSFTAVFKAKQYHLAVAVNNAAGGYIIGPDSTTLSYPYSVDFDYKTSKSYKAVAADGYEFVEWQDQTGTKITDNTTYIHKFEADESVTAVFKAKQYTLSINVNDSAAGTVIGPDHNKLSLPYSAAFDFNSTKTYTAKAADGYEFLEWQDDSGSKISNQASYTHQFKANTSVIAVFKKKPAETETKVPETEKAEDKQPETEKPGNKQPETEKPGSSTAPNSGTSDSSGSASSGTSGSASSGTSGSASSDTSGSASSGTSGSASSGTSGSASSGTSGSASSGTSGSASSGTSGSANNSAGKLPTGTIIKNNGLKYKIKKDGTAAYTGVTGEIAPASIKIPGTITSNGQKIKVTEIAADAFRNNKTIKNVVINANITKIGKNAFMNCTKLTSVRGCKNVTDIGANAFYGCKKLVTVGAKSNTLTLSSVKKIGDKAFCKCSSLKTVKLTSKALTKIGKMAFLKCTSLKSITISSKKLTSLGKYAFYGNKKLQMIVLKTSKLAAKSIGKDAFKGISDTATIKVNSKKAASYTTLFKEKGAPAGTKITKG